MVDMVRSRVFGEVAEVYDAARPGYVDALVTEVVAYAAPGGRGRAALEIGAGTGKATVAFAEALGGASGGAFAELVCVEPDARMAQVLRRNTENGPGARVPVRVHVGAFEDWRPDGRDFGLAFAATSWHWTDPQRRWDLVHDALAPGGALALFWNPQGVRDADLHAALAAVDRRHGVTGAAHGVLASSFGEVPGHWAGLPAAWPEDECRRDGRFTDLRSVRYRQDLDYDTDRYLGCLASLSCYRVLPAARRDEALAETAEVLDAHGGGIPMTLFNDLFLARTH
ncbi:class I SAM-dependent methyltransferase [Streptomyces sp. NPDC051582]|uniref:class I SAM-dependent methyltransferase n=1 Tax=Streptomyces sp. NPDC051582 TaxID=3155167 RepID=UPI00342321D0